MKYLPLEHFRSLGFLQEANRQFFHPLGLALEVTVDLDSGETTSIRVQDWREDPEGMFYSDELLAAPGARNKASYVASLAESKFAQRAAVLGRTTNIQPIPHP